MFMLTVALEASTSRFPIISDAVKALNSRFNTTFSEEAVVGVVLMAATLATHYLSSSTESNATNCTTSDAQLSSLWPPRFHSVIDTESRRLAEYNDQAAAKYRDRSLSWEKMHELFEKDRTAYVDFCRKRGQFKPIAAELRAEIGDREKPWIDCMIGEGETALKQQCFRAFDALRNEWNDLYTARLYREENYFESALSWITGKIWKQPASKLLKTIPQRIHDANLDGKNPDDAIKVLSFVTPFNKATYCKKGCAYVKPLYRKIMQIVHPDKSPFSDAQCQREELQTATDVAQVVNAAKAILCNEDTRIKLCKVS
jgi:hypothetical protein